VQIFDCSADWVIADFNAMEDLHRPNAIEDLHSAICIAGVS